MSKPYKEVVLFDNISVNDGKLVVTPDTKFQLKSNSVYILWRGTTEQFRKDFELPADAPLSTVETNPAPNSVDGDWVKNWDATTLNFKFNYQLWYRDKATSNTGNFYANGSTISVDITCPNVLMYNGEESYQRAIYYYNTSGVPERYYNPNLVPLPIVLSDFVISNKVNDFSYISGTAANRGCFLVFRYGVWNSEASTTDDIQICLLTRDTNNFSVNTSTIVMPYASLTFTGFNRIKRLN